MARQGNYVPISNIDTNWAKGVSGAFNNLSDMYANKAAAEKRDARNERLDLAQAKKDALTNRRTKQLLDHTDEAYNLEKNQREFYKNFKLEEEAVRRSLADRYGITEAELQGPQSAAFLKAINLTQEDVNSFYGKQFRGQFGTQFDPTKVGHTTSALPSLKALQASEDSTSELLASQADKFTTRQINALKGVTSGNNGVYDADGNFVRTKSKTTGKTKAPKTFGEILTADMVSEFSGSSWIPFTNTERENAKDVADSVVALGQHGVYKGQVTPRETEIVAKFVLDRLKTGGALDEIVDDKDKVASVTNQAMQEYITARDSGTLGGSFSKYSYGSDKGYQVGSPQAQSARDILLRIGSGDLSTYSPRNMKQVLRDKTLAEISRLRGGTLPAPTTPTNRKRSESLNPPKVVAPTGGDEAEILNNIGINNSQPKKPASTPTRAQDLKPFTPRLNKDGTLANGNEKGDIPTLDEWAIAEANVSKALPEVSQKAAKEMSYVLGNPERLPTFQEVEALAGKYDVNLDTLLKAVETSRDGIEAQDKKNTQRTEELRSKDFNRELLRTAEGALMSMPLTTGVSNIVGNTRAGVKGLAPKLKPLMQDIRFTREVLPALRRFANNASKVPFSQTRVPPVGPSGSAAERALNIPTVLRMQRQNIPLRANPNFVGPRNLPTLK